MKPSSGGLAGVALALGDVDQALRDLRVLTDALTHPEAKLRKLLRAVEVRLGVAARALARAQQRQA